MSRASNTPSDAIVWRPVYIALGSNLDEPRRQIAAAYERLEALPASRLIARSRLYATKAFGVEDQPDFLNAAAGMLTTLAPRELLAALKQIERTMGREQPIVRWGPRRIDLDLLVFADESLNETDIVVPHPGIPRRNFVLYPLCDIAPELRVPGAGVARDLMHRIGSDGVRAVS